MNVKDPEMLLTYAAGGNETETVNRLLDQGVDIHWGNDYAMRMAVGSGNAGMVDLLLARGSGISFDAMVDAASKSNMKMFKKLLKEGGKIDTPEGVNKPFLWFVVGGCDVEMVKELLDMGLEITLDVLNHAFDGMNSEVLVEMFDRTSGDLRKKFRGKLKRLLGEISDDLVSDLNSYFHYKITEG